MSKINIDYGLCTGCLECVKKCPFGSIEKKNKTIEINSSCKICKLCIKACPFGALSFFEEKKESIDKNLYKDILVFAEIINNKIHDVTFELIGEALRLSKNVGFNVNVICLGNDSEKLSKDILYYGVKKVFYYEDEALCGFRSDVYCDFFCDCINKILPSVVLIGATPLGRSLAPRIAARLKTGLTADCTKLIMKENTDLVQIRPAFGGNIMAQIITTNTRPQFATVRHKVMEAKEKDDFKKGELVKMNIDYKKSYNSLKIIKFLQKDLETNISEADLIVACGRGIKSEKDIKLIKKFADSIGAVVAGTRPLIESGLLDYTRQIGLSGRTVKPKLIITMGISGAVQFTASMKESDKIIAVNIDKNAPIFQIAHFGFVANMYEILPILIDTIKKEEN